MPAPNFAEIGRLNLHGLIAHYNNHKLWYLQQCRVAVTGAKEVLKRASASGTSVHYVLQPDDVEVLISTFLRNDALWNKKLYNITHLPTQMHAVTTESMARYITYDAYSTIVA